MRYVLAMINDSTAEREVWTMKRHVWVTAILAAVVLVMLSTSIQAHHSLPAYYDPEKTISITGVLKEVKIMNPHSKFVVEVTEPDGRKVIWGIIAGTGTAMAKAGWTNSTLKIGATVTVTGNPSRAEGTTGMVAKSFTTADGKVFTPGQID